MSGVCVFCGAAMVSYDVTPDSEITLVDGIPPYVSEPHVA